MMLFIVTLVSLLVQIYSIGYMHGDKRYPRYFAYLSLFSASMLALVIANNLLLMFMSWEIVGLTSYLLIGFWFEKGKDGIGNAQAAKKAFVVNRIGDFGLLLALFFLFWNFKSFDFAVIFAQAPQVALGGQEARWRAPFPLLGEEVARQRLVEGEALVG